MKIGLVYLLSIMKLRAGDGIATSFDTYNIKLISYYIYIYIGLLMLAAIFFQQSTVDMLNTESVLKILMQILYDAALPE